MEVAAAKLIGAGLAAMALIGAGIGVGNVFGSYLQGASQSVGCGRSADEPAVGLRALRSDGPLRSRRRVHFDVRLLISLSFTTLERWRRRRKRFPSGRCGAGAEHGDPTAEPVVTEDLTTSTEHAGDAHGAKPGLPQLDTSTFASQLFWLLISFAVLYFVISRIAAPKIGGVIADRANRIKSDLDSAARAKRDSEAAMAGYDKALADARAKAIKSSDEMRNAVQAEINAKNDAASKQLAADTSKAEARIGEMRKAAMARVGDVARETASDIVQKLSGEAANQAAIDAAVSTALAAKEKADA